MASKLERSHFQPFGHFLRLAIQLPGGCHNRMVNYETLAARLTFHPSGAHDDNIIFAALRQELLSLPSVKRVDLTPSESQAFGEHLTAKSGVAIGIAGLTVSVAPLALKQAVALLHAWTERQKARSVIMEIGGERIEITAGSNREQQQAMELFLQRHTRAPELPAPSE